MLNKVVKVQDTHLCKIHQLIKFYFYNNWYILVFKYVVLEDILNYCILNWFLKVGGTHLCKTDWLIKLYQNDNWYILVFQHLFLEDILTCYLEM